MISTIPPYGLNGISLKCWQGINSEKHLSALNWSKRVLYKHSDDMDAAINRQGYGLRERLQSLDAKPAEIKALLVNQLDPARASELRDRMGLAGLLI